MALQRQQRRNDAFFRPLALHLCRRENNASRIGADDAQNIPQCSSLRRGYNADPLRIAGQSTLTLQIEQPLAGQLLLQSLELQMPESQAHILLYAPGHELYPSLWPVNGDVSIDQNV